MKCFLGLDIGTTGVKAVVFDADGHPLGSGLTEYTLETPQPDIVELDAEIYWQAACQSIKQATREAGCDAKDIRAAAVTGQAETLVFTDKDGSPVRKAIVWLDNRAVQEAAELEKQFTIDTLFRLSGQTEMLPCWPAAKILWLRNHEPQVFAQTAKYLMVEDFIIHRLTGRFTTCRGLMPSSLYFDIRNGQYDQRILAALGISTDNLPELLDSGAVAGTCLPREGSPLAPGTLMVSAPIDHVCGNLGAGCNGPGMLSETTGCTLALCAAFPNTVYDEERRLSTYLGYRPGTSVLLPWAPTAGMLLKHFRDEFAADMSYAEFDAAAAAVAPGSDGLIILPHCAGAVSPVCNPNARGVAYGVTLAHKRGHWARAIMESIAYLLRDNIDVLRKLGADYSEIRCLGGASKSKLWLQIKADVLNLPVAVTDCPEATSLGAAMLAAVAAGEYADTNEAISRMVRLAARITPGPDAPKYQDALRKYRQLNDLLLPTF